MLVLFFRGALQEYEHMMNDKLESKEIKDHVYSPVDKNTLKLLTYRLKDEYIFYKSYHNDRAIFYY